MPQTYRTRYDFPTVAFVRNGNVSAYAYFNEKCNELFGGRKYIKIFKTSEHIIFFAADKR